MVKLQPLAGTELSPYVIELLAKHEIDTVRDFLTTDIAEISRKSNLSLECIQDLRIKLRDIHNPKRFNLLQYYKNVKSCRQIYGFGIESLDKLLGEQTFCNTGVFEIFGPSAIGKTRFCHTVALNLVSSRKVEALYIDTKQDFSGICLYQMLRAQGINKNECGQIMQRIKVERTFKLQGVLDILKHLDGLLESGTALVAAIRLVIIDSLPAVWFTLNGDDERLERKYLLCKIANLLHKLARERFIAILLVNLAVQEEDLYVENADISEIGFNAERLRQSSLDSNPNENHSLKPALGRYWSTVPHTRLYMKMIEDADEFSTERLIEVARNCYGPNGGFCRLRIDDAGVVS